MVEILNKKQVTYKKKSCTAELCLQTTWSADNQKIKTFLGTVSGCHTSCLKTVNKIKKQGVIFIDRKNYFVRLMDRKKDTCIIVLKHNGTLKSAEKQFEKLKK